MFNKIKNNVSNKNNRKKGVEIYFILYLAALVILISEGKFNQANNEDAFVRKDIELPFRIKAEKPILICRISFDKDGKRVINLDSLNFIWEAGNVRDVRYEFVVEDQDLRHIVRLNNSQSNNFQSNHHQNNLHQGNRHFSFIEDEENRAAIFLWQPEIYDNSNKTFIVYVTATATSNEFADNQHSTEDMRVVARTQFSLVITNDNDPNLNYFAMNNDAMDAFYGMSGQHNIDFQSNNPFQNNINPNIYFPSSADFRIHPQEFRIRTIANQEWENEIFCHGISPRIHLNKPPTVRIENSPENNGGTVNAPIIRDNSIILRGRAPIVGSSKISVTVVRSGDLREMTAFFEILPVTFGVPDFPSEMFPGREYTFNPRISNELNNISVLIKDKDVIRFQSSQGSEFRFTADVSDIGKTLSFERYTNGQLLGQKHNIIVSAFPPPEITRISRREKNVAILEVTSFGLHNGRENNIREIKLTGNAKANQLYGRTRPDKVNLLFLEQYRIVPNDINAPFTFEAVAIDQRGEHSKPKSYNEN